MFTNKFVQVRQVAAALLVAIFAFTGSAFAQGGFNAYAVTTSDRLVSFNTANACAV